MEEHAGPITGWKTFEEYPWPDPAKADLRHLEWLEKNLPDDICAIASGAHYCEWLAWLMGYETLCYALHDDRELIEALYAKIHHICTTLNRLALQFSRVKVVWGSDDMGYRQGLLFAPADMRRYRLAGHKVIAAMAHERGCPYLLHSRRRLHAGERQQHRKLHPRRPVSGHDGRGAEVRRVARTDYRNTGRRTGVAADVFPLFEASHYPQSHWAVL